MFSPLRSCSVVSAFADKIHTFSISVLTPHLPNTFPSVWQMLPFEIISKHSTSCFILILIFVYFQHSYLTHEVPNTEVPGYNSGQIFKLFVLLAFEDFFFPGNVRVCKLRRFKGLEISPFTGYNIVASFLKRLSGKEKPFLVLSTSAVFTWQMVPQIPIFKSRLRKEGSGNILAFQESEKEGLLFWCQLAFGDRTWWNNMMAN